MLETLLAVMRAPQHRIGEREETVLRQGQKPRPNIAPRRLEQPPRPAHAEGQKRPGSQKRPKNSQLTLTQERWIPFPDPPPGSVSKG